MSIHHPNLQNPGAQNEYREPVWVPILVWGTVAGLFLVILWLWFRCGNEPDVDFLLNGARRLPGVG